MIYLLGDLTKPQNVGRDFIHKLAENDDKASKRCRVCFDLSAR